MPYFLVELSRNGPNNGVGVFVHPQLQFAAQDAAERYAAAYTEQTEQRFGPLIRARQRLASIEWIVVEAPDEATARTRATARPTDDAQR